MPFVSMARGTALQTVAYSSSLTINFSTGSDVVVGTLTGNITINAPLNPTAGHLTIYLTQDSTGGRVATWNSVFSLSGTLPTTPGLTTAVEFGWNGSKWVQVGVYSTPAVADTTVPVAPTVTATAGDAQVALTWTGATDNVAVVGYEVYRGGVLVGSPTAASFTDTLLTNGTSYTYTVKAVDAAGNKSVASVAVAATPQGVVAGANRRPFSPSVSPFNRTLAEKFPSGIPVASLNDTYITNIIEYPENSQVFPHWGSNTAQYTLAVYVVEPSWLTGTPTQLAYSGIHCEASETSVTQQTGGSGSPYTFPFVVPASLKPADGTDGQFVLWDRDNLLAHASGPQFWDIWQIPTNGDGTWQANGAGRLQCTNFTHAIGELASDGAYTAGPVAYASRGPGFPYMAGLVRKWEVDAGVIDHAIACAWDQPASSYIFPASKSDGSSTLANDLPEGALLKLKDSFPVTDLTSATARIFAVAAQKYGLVVADNSGTSKVYWEADESVGLGADWGGASGANILDEIPIDEFVCVDPNGTSSLRESDARIDTSKSDDPVGTQTAVVSTTQASSASAASQAVTAPALTSDELVTLTIAMKDNDVYVTGVTGTNGLGGTWKRLRRFDGGANLQMEVWWTRATSGTAGTATAALSQTVPVNGTLIRHTVGSAIRKKFGKYATSAAPLVRLRSTTSLSLSVCVAVVRGNQTLTKESAATLLGTANYGGASNANLPATTAMSLPGGGDVTHAPTIGASAEHIIIAYEVT